jgi:hypothetical protein
VATYFTSCGSLTGWYETGKTAGENYSTDGTVITSLGNTGERLALTAVDSDAERQDVEILLKCKISTFSTTTTFALVRGSGTGVTASSYSAYLAMLRATSVRMYKLVTGTLTQLAEKTGKTHSNGTYYWVRFRVNSTSLYIKTWADGGSEPANWDIDAHSNSDVSGDGYVGIYFNDGSTNTLTAAAFGAGTNGDTAPSTGTVALVGYWGINA